MPRLHGQGDQIGSQVSLEGSPPGRRAQQSPQPQTGVVAPRRQVAHGKRDRGGRHAAGVAGARVLTGCSSSFVWCWDTSSSSMGGCSCTISCMEMVTNRLKDSSCCRTRPFSRKYELMTSQHACCHTFSSFSSDPLGSSCSRGAGASSQSMAAARGPLRPARTAWCLSAAAVTRCCGAGSTPRGKRQGYEAAPVMVSRPARKPAQQPPNAQRTRQQRVRMRDQCVSAHLSHAQARFRTSDAVPAGALPSASLRGRGKGQGWQGSTQLSPAELLHSATLRRRSCGRRVRAMRWSQPPVRPTASSRSRPRDPKRPGDCSPETLWCLLLCLFVQGPLRAQPLHHKSQSYSDILQ